MRKRQKLIADDARRRFATALARTLSVGFAQQPDLARLLLVCQSSRAAVASWLQVEFAADVSMGKELIPVPVLTNAQSCSQSAWLLLLLTLLDFEYCVQSRCSLPRHRHTLSPGAAARAQRDELVQRVLRGRHVRVAVSRSTHSAKGWCVAASERIPRGAYIGEYSGDLISTRQMQARFKQQTAANDRNYVLVLREVASRANDDAARVERGEAATGSSFCALRTIVDATACGSFTRLINHSCDPNLTLTAVRVDSLIPRLVLVAKRDIVRNEELSFDYSGDADADALTAPAMEREEAREDERNRTRCLCEATCCRGFLPSDASV